MTKSTTRKSPAKKKAESAPTEPTPMDPTPILSGTEPTPITARPAYAATALVAEVNEMFEGEVPHEFSGPGRFRVLHDVTFDVTTLDETDATMLAKVLVLAEEDKRVREVLVEPGQIVVSILSHPTRQEDRSSFGLASARAILAGEEQ